MEAMAVLIGGAVLGFLAAGARHASGVRSRGDRAEASAALRELIAEHLGLARERLGAAEARIALLEERLAFHDGFLRIAPPEDGVPIEPFALRAERVARMRRRPATHPVGSPTSGPGVLQFPTADPSTEETPNYDL